MTRKKRILQAATHLLSIKGYKDASMAELAKLTGVAQGTIFYHYKNKEELFLSILDVFKQDILSEFDGFLREKPPASGLDMVEQVMGFYLYLAGKMEDRFLLLHRHDAYEIAKANTICREYLEAIYDCLVDIFEKAIRAGQKDGSIADLPARKTALIIFTLVDGLIRFKTYDLYDPAALYDDLIASVRKILTNHQPET